MSAIGRGAPAQPATADREIVISRVIGAPRELVFEAFTDVRHLSRWWGPEGFTTTTRAFEFRVGGEWDFVMHGPDGTDYQEWISWTEIAAPERSAPLDGFIAPEERMDDPDVQRWMAQWMELQQWIFPQRFFRENLKLGEGGEEGRDNDIGRDHLPLRQRRHRARARPGPRGRRRPGRPHRGRRRNDPGVRERRPDRRVHDRALTRAVRLRNPPVRGRGRGPRGPGACPRGADAAGHPPDLCSPGAVTVSTSALPRRGQQRGEILDALSVRKGGRSGRALPRE